MKNELFRQLLVQARQRDCWLIHLIYNLQTSLGQGPLQPRIKLATGLYDAGKEFQDRMNAITAKHAATLTAGTVPFQRTQTVWRCPQCGDPYCTAAIPMVKISIETEI